MKIPAFVQHNIELKKYSTIQIGGPALFYAPVKTISELKEALNWSKDRQLQTFILGGGSNSILNETPYPGLVVHIQLNSVTHLDKFSVLVGAGVDWGHLCTFAFNNELFGLECLVGIPGTVGASPIQNVGAYGSEVSEVIDEVHYIDLESLKEKTLSNENCEFGYRDSIFKNRLKDKTVITSVKFRFKSDRPSALKYKELTHLFEAKLREAQKTSDKLSNHDYLFYVRKCVVELRASKGMVLDPNDPCSISLGSFFTNPVLNESQFEELKRIWPQKTIPSFETSLGIKVPAAWLIEASGFTKGQSFGNIGISSKHSLALINLGGASRSDLLLASQSIQSKVLQLTKIRLEIEPILMRV